MRSIAIGGLGGSGTRLVCDIFKHWGFFMGTYLNESLDNLVFTILFKNPQWFKNASAEEINQRIEILTQLGLHKKLTSTQAQLFIELAKSHPNHPYNDKEVTHLLRFDWIKRTPEDWGWKEPNTHLYIEHLLTALTNLKYIHVVRHGFDMALSKNTQQLQNWGERFNIDFNQPIKDQQFEYWVKANSRIIELQKWHTNIYILNFDKLNENPEKELIGLANFIDIEESKVNSVLYLPKKQPRKFDINHGFREDQVIQLQELGFDAELS